MSSQNYKRTPDELRKHASMFWPPELSEKEAELSVIPRLLGTQDQFIAILSLDVEGLEEFFELVNLTRLPANMFVKHLVIIADFGGDRLLICNLTFLM